ncbi:5-guanidino-2-oxopentanoate decarboxylase [Aliigemmobacter aestuarii]|uniref:5-guanidino-2-oxopentanoate decarboxylase n=1 Tax=Aliigemmobacter aestuarii TaxID=1445661 RepID=A0A4S3MK65_9RHOB|nr:5-guanidino-2-oxopentanoate decarboxylase [Gemmobacter aestuarii]THD81413.1 5-guanidino-2-oxopentanoate decarboxylase [Gemmobacter aestuarii]
MRSVGEELAAGLAARGVEVVFGIPGVHTVELYRGLPGSGIRHVTARHEQGAAFMADGYARVSGKPGVALVITGPGLTNALTAMAQARADSVPMLVISGVNRRATLGQGMGWLHELPDQQGMVKPLCPTIQVTGAEALAPALDRAFALLGSGRPGPVHLEVPTDVMSAPCPPLPAPVAVAPLWPDPDALADAAARLSRAQHPVILAGGGTRHAAAALRRLAEALDAPVIQTVNARGAMHGHPLTVPGSPSLDAVRAVIAASDQVLAIGTELGPTDYDMYVRGGLPDLSGMIRIDLCPEQLARHPAALRIRAEAGAAMTALCEALPPRRGDGATRAAAARLAARAELAGLSPAMPGQLAAVEAIREAMPGAIIVGDSTQPVYAANLYYDHDRPGGWFNAATGYGALGFGPGAAVGAAIAAGGAPVVCLIGDGGLQFSPGELRTAVDEDLPLTFLVWNNAGFREIAEAMAGAGAAVVGCTPSPLRMEPFAAACDLPFQSVPPDPAAIRAALAAPGTGPRMIEVRVP